MRGEGFDGEGAGDADLFGVVIGLVVEVFGVGFGGDGGIDLALAGDTLLPPFGVEFFGGRGPGGIGFARDLPLFPGLSERGVEPGAQGFQGELELVPDDVDFGVVGDALERDVRDALIDEALAEVAARGVGGGRGAGDLAFFALAFGAIGEEEVRIACAHDAGASESECHAGGVDGDPAAAPLLCDVGGGAGAAGGVED